MIYCAFTIDQNVRIIKMAKFSSKYRTVEAIQWYENGDHPDDNCVEIQDSTGEVFMSEGKVIRYYRHPYVSGKTLCTRCERTMNDHGWIDQTVDDFVVCPSDWIVWEEGSIYPIPNSIFNLLFISEGVF
jgi:hypothetical protein